VSQDRDSLDRFLQTRGAQIVGRSMGQISYKVQGLVGIGITALGFTFLASPLLGAPPEVMMGAIGPMVAGTINLSLAYFTRKRLATQSPSEVVYSPDARALLLTLYRQVSGVNYGFGMMSPMNRRHMNIRMRRRMAMAGMDGTIPEPANEVLAYLERAAVSYQRIAAVIALGKNQPAVAKLGPRAALAAEESMADIFHHAATLCRYPEGLDSGRQTLTAQISSLDEIAAGLEALTSTSSEPIKLNRSNLDDLLTDIRLEQLARTELRPLRADGGESVSGS